MSKKTTNYGIIMNDSSIQGNVEITNRDITNIHSNLTKDEFANLLEEIQEALSKSNINSADRRGASSNVDIALEQTGRKKPNGKVIVSSLTTALSLISQVGGAAKGIEHIGDLLSKAITYAQHLF